MNNIFSEGPSRWAFALSDIVIVFSCLSGALAFLLVTRHRPSTVLSRLFLALAVLVGALGIAHTVSVLRFPAGMMDPALRLLSALCALVASLALWPLVRRATNEPRRTLRQLQSVIRQLEHEVQERKRAELQLKQSQELLRQLSAYQEQVKEDERKRIAREIHDELGQNLMALRIDISMLHARTGGSHPLLHQMATRVLGHIDNAIKSVRAIINNLRPSVLDLGLYAALEWQVSEFERRTGISCDLIIDESNEAADQLDDHRATALFRILQESLTNVARHAEATMVSIGLRHENERLVMKISDDGVGIYPGCRRKPNSFGLVGIGERVSSLRGEFNVDSVPGQGTVLTISIPLVISPEADEAVTGSARSKSASPESVLLRPMDRSREYRAAKMNDQ